jgi:hypothetical protein
VIHTAVDGSLKFDTKIDTDGFKRGTNTIKTQADGLKGILLSVGKTIALVFGVRQLIKFGKQAVETASDLTEVQNVVDTAFGNMAYKMEEFAKTSIETYGLSKLASKQMGSLFMAMSTGMGQASDVASDMAVNITGRLADIMSFYNKTKDEVQTIGKAVYTGETEPLKAIGLVATETNLSLFALQNGFRKAYSDMTANEKLLVRQMYFLDKTSLAAGDFAKTSGTWANQTRILSEQWKEFLGIIGTGLIQVLTPAVRFLNTSMSYLITMAETVSQILSSIFGLKTEVVQSVGAISTGADDAASGISKTGDAVEKAGKQAQKAAAPFDQLNQVASDAGTAGSNISVPGTNVEKGEPAEKVDSAVIKSFDDLRKAIDPTLDSLNKLKDKLKPIAQFAFDNLKSLYKDFLNPVGKWVLGEGLPGLLDALSNLLSDIDWPKLSGAIKDFNKAITPLTIAVGTGFINFVKDLSNFLKPALVTTVDLLADALTGIADVLSNIDPDDMENIGYALGILGTGIAGVKISDKLPGLLLRLGIGFESFAMGLSNLAYLNPVMLPALFDLFGLDDWMDDLYNKLPDWARGLWEGFWRAIEDGIKEIFTLDRAMGAFGQMADTFREAFEGDKAWYEIGGNIIKGIFEGIGAILTTLDEIAENFFKLLWYHICNAFGIASPAKEMKPIGNYIMLGILKGFLDKINEWTTALSKFASDTIKDLKKWAGDTWNAIKGKFADVGSWFYGKFSTAWTNIKSIFNLSNIETHFQSILDKIKSIFKGIADWFKNIFTEAWTNVKNVFSTGGKIFDGIKDGISDVFRTVVNKLIDGMNTLISVPFNKINEMLNSIRTVSVLGVKPFNGLWGYNPLPVPKIPKLATGTVVPKNYGEFLSILGDNKREAEVVSPLSTIKQAIREVMSEKGGSGGEYTFIAQLDGKTIFKETVKQDQLHKKSTGRSAFAY